jgi:hypothetical protein
MTTTMNGSRSSGSRLSSVKLKGLAMSSGFYAASASWLL